MLMRVATNKSPVGAPAPSTELHINADRPVRMTRRLRTSEIVLSGEAIRCNYQTTG